MDDIDDEEPPPLGPLQMLVVKLVTGRDIQIHVRHDMQIRQLKILIKEGTGVHESRQRLIYRGRVLDDALTIQEYNIGEGHAIHMVARPENFVPPPPRSESQSPVDNASGSASADLLSNLLTAILQPNVTSGSGAGTAAAAAAAHAPPGVSTLPTLEHLRQGIMSAHTIISTMNPNDISAEDMHSTAAAIHSEAANNTPSSDNFSESRRKFYVGQWIDVKDTVNQWLEGTVMEVDNTNMRLYVHYNGWPVRWDEWIQWNSPRIAPFRTRTNHISHGGGSNGPTNNFLSPHVNTVLAQPPFTGTDDIRVLMPEIANLFQSMQPLVEEMAVLSAQSLQFRPTASNVAVGTSSRSSSITGNTTSGMNSSSSNGTTVMPWDSTIDRMNKRLKCNQPQKERAEQEKEEGQEGNGDSATGDYNDFSIGSPASVDVNNYSALHCPSGHHLQTLSFSEHFNNIECEMCHHKNVPPTVEDSFFECCGPCKFFLCQECADILKIQYDEQHGFSSAKRQIKHNSSSSSAAALLGDCDDGSGDVLSTISLSGHKRTAFNDFHVKNCSSSSSSNISSDTNESVAVKAKHGSEMLASAPIENNNNNNREREAVKKYQRGNGCTYTSTVHSSSSTLSGGRSLSFSSRTHDRRIQAREVEARLRYVVRTLCPLFDRFGRIIADSAPYLNEYPVLSTALEAEEEQERHIQEQLAATAADIHGIDTSAEAAGDLGAATAAAAHQEVSYNTQNTNIPSTAHTASVPRATPSTSVNVAAAAPLPAPSNSLEAAIFNLLRGRPPSPTPQNVYRTPITNMPPVPRLTQFSLGAGGGAGVIGGLGIMSGSDLNGLLGGGVGGAAGLAGLQVLPAGVRITTVGPTGAGARGGSGAGNNALASSLVVGNNLRSTAASIGGASDSANSSDLSSRTGGTIVRHPAAIAAAGADNDTPRSNTSRDQIDNLSNAITTLTASLNAQAENLSRRTAELSQRTNSVAEYTSAISELLRNVQEQGEMVQILRNELNEVEGSNINHDNDADGDNESDGGRDQSSSPRMSIGSDIANNATALINCSSSIRSSSNSLRDHQQQHQHERPSQDEEDEDDYTQEMLDDLSVGASPLPTNYSSSACNESVDAVSVEQSLQQPPDVASVHNERNVGTSALPLPSPPAAAVAIASAVVADSTEEERESTTSIRARRASLFDRIRRSFSSTSSSSSSKR